MDRKSFRPSFFAGYHRESRFGVCATHRVVTLGDQFDEVAGEFGFGGFRKFAGAIMPQHVNGIVIVIETSIVTNLVRNDHVQFLLFQFRARVVLDILRFCRETYGEWRRVQRGD